MTSLTSYVFGGTLSFPIDKVGQEELWRENELKTGTRTGNEKEIEVEGEINKIILCPIEISVSKKIFFTIFILSFIQFILVFLGIVIINGFIALMLMIASLGFLFMINKILVVWRKKNKNFIAIKYVF